MLGSLIKQYTSCNLIKKNEFKFERKININKKVFVIGVILIGIIVVTFYNIFLNGKTEEIEITQDFSHVEVESENANINVIASNNNTAKAELVNNKNNKYKLDVKVDGNTLEIEVNRRGFKWLSIDFFSDSPTLNLMLPEKVAGTIALETNNGTISASNLESEEMVAESDNGEILIGDVKSNSIYAQSDNGELFFENIEGEILGESDNGDITLVNDTLNQPIEFETDNGSIIIQTKKEPKNVKMDVYTDNGNINIFGKSNESTVIGNGENLIKLTSDNGDITVEK
ncbi:DUF4097 family beta strand repeat-containing protein [Lysinibacillus telephonicus]|uniref:DUF4097 family beta strand repeat-containing protein n=1 Tax=Lysinibacillus telephonicus TaxID=1714840 RepID=UPI0031FCD029